MVRAHPNDFRTNSNGPESRAIDGQGTSKRFPNESERTRPATPWTETVEEFGARFRIICQDINEHCDVEGLCRKFPKRVQAAVDAKGDHIKE